MTTYYIKLITGFRDDQYISVPMQEAHKAYYLFDNPEQRGKFDNGLALVGSAIKEIHPDWNATMGWNPDHKITADDYNEINRAGANEKMNTLLQKARQSVELVSKNPELLKLPLKEVIPLLSDDKNLLDGLIGGINKLK